MGSEWKTSTFADAPMEIIDGDRGVNYPKQSDFCSSGHCLFLNAGNVTATGFKFSDCAFISEDKDAALRKGKVKRQDVVLTTRGTVGNAAYFDDSVPFENIRINSGMVILRSDTSALLPRFLYLFVRSTAFRNQVASLRTGSAQPQLPIKDINRIEIPLPPFEEQRAIAHILGSLDDKIELNRKMNETLEAMARAIFKSWFVDFDPVCAKAEGRDPGLPKEIADLFPDSFEDSEMGEIPKGWKVKQIGDVVHCVGGATPSTKEPLYWEGGTSPFVTPRDMSNLNSPVILDSERYITQEGVDTISSGLLPAGTVLLSSRAPIGYLAIAEVPVSINQGIIAMICDGVLPNYYVLFWAETYMEAIKSNAGGTTFAEISKKNFRPINIVVPAPKVLGRFVDYVKPLYEKIICNLIESKNLITLRDALLPKLISGEIHIKDAEKFVESNL